MVTAKTLTYVGLTMQVLGAIALYIQIWGKRWAFAFDTSEGGLIDKGGYWARIIQWGWLVYILSYLPILLAESMN